MFNLIQHPGKTQVLFNQNPILSLIDEHLIQRQAMIADARLRPDGPIEIATMFTSCFFGPHLLRNAVTVDIETPHRVVVTVQPEKVDKELLKYVNETRRFTIEYDESHDRFRYHIDVGLDFLEDIHGNEGLHLNGMPIRDGRRAVVLEIDDPLLSGGIGPQVPMTQDWTGLPEPLFGEHQFTTTWKKRYLSVLLETAEHGYRRLVFNRTTNSVSQFFNRHVLEGVPQTSYYYERTDGRYLRFTPLFEHPTGHHICEWSYDMHWYAIVPPAGDDCLFRKGQHLALSYEIEEVEGAEVPEEYIQAPLAELEPDERDLADRPIYEEPCCRFTESTLDNPDNYRWYPTDNCTWNRTGGHSPNTGALEIRPDGQEGCNWTFPSFGPSLATNPIPPLSRFRISAWIKADEPAKAELRFTTNSHAGPAPFSKSTPVTSNGRLASDAPTDGSWQKLEFVSAPSGSYTLTGLIVFSYSGRGAAALSELSVVRL